MLATGSRGILGPMTTPLNRKPVVLVASLVVGRERFVFGGRETIQFSVLFSQI